MVVNDTAESVPGTSRGRIPDFFIVGQAKSGTTALYEMLRKHPEIFMPDLKEPEFLASDMHRRFRAPMTGRLPETLDEYLMLFADAQENQKVGEASVLYLTSRTAASAIAELNPAGRIIAVFREPASFLRSLHLQHLQNHNEDQRDLGKALALEADRGEGRNIPRRSYRPQVLQYFEHVCYTEQLTRYHATFAPERTLVLIYDDLRRENETTVRKILRFLEVDDSIAVQPVNANPTVALRSQALDNAVHRFSVGRGPLSNAVKSAIKTVLPTTARRRALHTVQRRVVHTGVPAADEELLGELRRRLKPEVERFGAYLGRDLVSMWGYENV